jgi:hypothetical protein
LHPFHIMERCSQLYHTLCFLSIRCFPLLSPIIVGNAVHLNYAVFAFAGGFGGMLLSPLHLCLALTKDYFQAQWGPLYRMLVPSVAVVTVTAVLLLFILD